MTDESMRDEDAARDTSATLQALIKNAVLKDFKYCVCVEGEHGSTVLASNLGEDIKTARFLEKFARQCRSR